MLKRNYLLLTESEFYLDVREALEQTKHRLKAVDPLQADWGSHNALLNYYETNLQSNDARRTNYKNFCLSTTRIY